MSLLRGDSRSRDPGERTARKSNPNSADFVAHNVYNPYNGYYECPDTMRLLGDVTGRPILDTGCGSRTLTESLVDHGAAVTAFYRFKTHRTAFELVIRAIGYAPW